MALTILAGFLMLIVVVVVHEAGHAFAARLCGVGVAEFGIGFGKPRIKLFEIKKIPIYLCLWLLGGYVRIKTKSDLKSREAEGKNFEEISLGGKILVLTAGVAANLVLAIILRMILFVVFPQGGNFQLLALPVALAPSPDWYLIPAYSVILVFKGFYLWVLRTSIIILLVTPIMIANLISLTSVPQAGMIATVGLGSLIHSGVGYYLGMIYYVSILIAALNIIPICPLDGGNIVLSALQTFFNRRGWTGNFAAGCLWAYQKIGLIIIIILLAGMVLSDLGDIASQFRQFFNFLILRKFGGFFNLGQSRRSVLSNIPTFYRI